MLNASIMPDHQGTFLPISNTTVQRTSPCTVYDVVMNSAGADCFLSLDMSYLHLSMLWAKHFIMSRQGFLLLSKPGDGGLLKVTKIATAHNADCWAQSPRTKELEAAPGITSLALQMTKPRELTKHIWVSGSIGNSLEKESACLPPRNKLLRATEAINHFSPDAMLINFLHSG